MIDCCYNGEYQGGYFAQFGVWKPSSDDQGLGNSYKGARVSFGADF